MVSSFTWNDLLDLKHSTLAGLPANKQKGCAIMKEWLQVFSSLHVSFAVLWPFLRLLHVGTQNVPF